MEGISQQRDAAADQDDDHLKDGGESERGERDPDGADALAGLERGIGAEIVLGMLVPTDVEDGLQPAEWTTSMNVPM